MRQDSPIRNLSRRKLSDEILDRLIESIRQGAVRPGSTLPSERALMVEFGVGRPAVREALQALESMGVVRIQHGERARVSPLEPRAVLERIDRTVRLLLETSPELHRHVREARLMFETGMVRLAARAARPADIAGLRALLDNQATAKGDPAGFVAADMAFHTGIATVSGNPIFTAVSEALLGWVFELYPGLLRVPGTEDLTLREHAAVLRAIERKDEAAAVRALKRHLVRSNPGYRKAEGN